MEQLKMKAYLTTKEAAEYLNIPLKTLYFYIHKKIITFYKTGNKGNCTTLFKPADLDNFLVRNEAQPTAEQKADEYLKLHPTERIS